MHLWGLFLLKNQTNCFLSNNIRYFALSISIHFFMNFLKKLFSKNDAPLQSYADFWSWFQKEESQFFYVVKNQGNIDKVFFQKLMPKLKQITEDMYFVTGMCEDDQAELVLTPDGQIDKIVFAEELVAAAPKLARWKFTALKSPMDVENVQITMNGFDFHADNLHFYPNELPDFPDEIDLTIVYHNFEEANKAKAINGVYIFLDNYLGELNFAEKIDSLTITGPTDDAKELIPIKKLKQYLNWRQKEFIEKYEGLKHNTENDTFSLLRAELKNGLPLLAVINTDLINWDKKASHPWILAIEIEYDGAENNGLPNNETLEKLTEIEDLFLADLKDVDGYLNIGRQTAENVRVLYFACKEFRYSSKVAFKLQQRFQGEYKMKYGFYKDKYWRSFDRFNPTL